MKVNGTSYLWRLPEWQCHQAQVSWWEDHECQPTAKHPDPPPDPDEGQVRRLPVMKSVSQGEPCPPLIRHSFTQLHTAPLVSGRYKQQRGGRVGGSDWWGRKAWEEMRERGMAGRVGGEGFGTCNTDPLLCHNRVHLVFANWILEFLGAWVVAERSHDRKMKEMYHVSCKLWEIISVEKRRDWLRTDKVLDTMSGQTYGSSVTEEVTHNRRMCTVGPAGRRPGVLRCAQHRHVHLRAFSFVSRWRRRWL